MQNHDENSSRTPQTRSPGTSIQPRSQNFEKWSFPLSKITRKFKKILTYWHLKPVKVYGYLGVDSWALPYERPSNFRKKQLHTFSFENRCIYECTFKCSLARFFQKFGGLSYGRAQESTPNFLPVLEGRFFLKRWTKSALVTMHLQVWLSSLFSEVWRPLIWESSRIDPQFFTGFRRPLFPQEMNQKCTCDHASSSVT
jgi:hypothetical protein